MMQQYRSNSYLFGGNAPYVEEMYEAYLDNPGSVPDNWRDYFDALQHVPAVDGSNSRDVAHAPVVESFAQRAKANAFAWNEVNCVRNHSTFLFGNGHQHCLWEKMIELCTAFYFYFFSAFHYAFG